MDLQGPTPHQWERDETDVKRYFPIQVAFPDPSIVNGVLQVLPWCISAAEGVIEIFDPVFHGYHPPLPGTAVRTIRG